MKVMVENAKNSREEAECFRFDVLRDAKDPTKFTFYECYTNSEAKTKMMDKFAYYEFPYESIEFT